MSIFYPLRSLSAWDYTPHCCGVPLRATGANGSPVCQRCGKGQDEDEEPYPIDEEASE